MSATLENMAINLTGADWQEKNEYRFHLLLVPEEDGSWSAIVLNLPGVGSCGKNEEIAMNNVKDAIRVAIEAYNDVDIPWKENDVLTNAPPGAKQRWIILDA